MPGAILEALTMMLGAAVLGGIIVWLLLRSQIAALQEQLNGVERRTASSDDGASEEVGRLQKELSECGETRQALTQEVDTLKQQQAASQKELADAEAALAAVNAELAKAKEAPAPAEEPEATPPPAKKPAKETEEETLARVKERAQEINFERIGTATADQKDDLKRIKGIGPFIEKKLNAIDIFTFEQVSRFTPEDEEKVNEVIEFFPGRIKRDNWRGQAADFAKEKEA